MGFFNKLFRKQYGRAQGFNFKGVMTLTVENNQVVLYSIGAEDIILTKENVASIELVASSVPVSNFIQSGVSVVNEYMVKMKDGSVGSLSILAGEAYRLLSVLQ